MKSVPKHFIRFRETTSETEKPFLKVFFRVSFKWCYQKVRVDPVTILVVVAERGVYKTSDQSSHDFQV